MTAPLPPPERKAAFVREMFARIAGGYDRMNRLMTLGRDRAWRRYTVEQVLPALPAPPVPSERPGAPPPSSGPRDKQSERWVLDVATGTGDLAFEVQRQRPALRVAGVDFVPQMLALAQAKAAEKGEPGNVSRLDLAAGDALRLPFPDGWFDAVVTGFAMRNVTDIPAAFAEMARVTHPGGRIACLEIAKPRLPIFRRLFTFYFYRLVPILGVWVAGEHGAYTYLPHSLTAFLTPDQIAAVMRCTGWRDVRHRRLMLGTVAVHVGIRE